MPIHCYCGAKAAVLQRLLHDGECDDPVCVPHQTRNDFVEIR
jgi:hypothetical protein